MTPHEFVNKWREITTSTERQVYQQHFLDLCELVGHQKTADLDPDNNFFTFEAGATKQSGGNGWADVWYRGHFAIEYKKPDAGLDKAYIQLLQYCKRIPIGRVQSGCRTTIVPVNANVLLGNTTTMPVNATIVPDNANFLPGKATIAPGNAKSLAFPYRLAPISAHSALPNVERQQCGEQRAGAGCLASHRGHVVPKRRRRQTNLAAAHNTIGGDVVT